MRSSLIREFGRVGMTERAAREAGRRVKTARFDMRRNGKAVEIGETAGFIKVMVDAEIGPACSAPPCSRTRAPSSSTSISI